MQLPHHKQPLAHRLRPRNLQELKGQEKILHPGSPLYQAIESGHLFSMILFGPPGCGKTTLARIMEKNPEMPIYSISAVEAGVAQIKKIIDSAKDTPLQKGQVVLFIDEIHRLNKGQQDILLPPVESGQVILIGLTTENPAYEVNYPLLSRLHVFKLQPLGTKVISELIDLALGDQERGFGNYSISLSDDAREHIVYLSGGDARKALNILEQAVYIKAPKAKDTIDIDKQTVIKAAGHVTIGYDKAGDKHYDTISAFIKSMRGSDPDATLYYLARMLEGGEDARFIMRRILIFASEDIGLADPTALILASSAAYALDWVGMPEGKLILSHAAVYCACAPKSNSTTVGIMDAMKYVKHKGKDQPIPPHIAHTVEFDPQLKGTYRYPHDFPGAFIVEEYLPEAARGVQFFKPKSEGREASIKERLKYWWKRRNY